MKKTLSGALLATVAVLAFTANAEEAPIYESLSEVSIGRVFFTAKQRAHLDSLRGKSGVESSTTAKPRSSSSKPANPDAAGFIIRNSGMARVYRNGDFVEVASKPDVEFPDDVTVTRKSSAEDGALDDDAQ